MGCGASRAPRLLHRQKSPPPTRRDCQPPCTPPFHYTGYQDTDRSSCPQATSRVHTSLTPFPIAISSGWTDISRLPDSSPGMASPSTEWDLFQQRAHMHYFAGRAGPPSRRPMNGHAPQLAQCPLQPVHGYAQGPPMQGARTPNPQWLPPLPFSVPWGSAPQYTPGDPQLVFGWNTYTAPGPASLQLPPNGAAHAPPGMYRPPGPAPQLSQWCPETEPNPWRRPVDLVQFAATPPTLHQAAPPQLQPPDLPGAIPPMPPEEERLGIDCVCHSPLASTVSSWVTELETPEQCDAPACPMLYAPSPEPLSPSSGATSQEEG
eukprot:TRINITY_DN12689_c0_g1_i3.p2 TRINITY_DN12689_c0_g1~~TRINITY_DN12689_c0_g1_i3.p2  ORF type:complete len:319 (+),score=33.12 TRINITY_DN12689_c0_g1_i3:173-1129(+)